MVRLNAIARFNARLAVLITSGVATMWCAYAFFGLALVSLPAAIQGGVATLVAWTAQTFLQLVLLSIIMVGQKVEGDRTEKRDQETHDAVMDMLGEVHAMHKETHRHLGVKAKN